MTTHPVGRTAAQPMILPFPATGPLIDLAYRELHLAVNGTPQERREIGDPSQLPRPWEPATCRTPELRQQLWQWLDDVVTWLNHEYTWDTEHMIPSCWAEHPHLVHEIAVIADQRRRAHLDPTSNSLEEWHRYCLPAFTDRMRTRLKSHCDHTHGKWPGRGRQAEHTSEATTEHRQAKFNADLTCLSRQPTRQPNDPTPPMLTIVDETTGEIHDS